MNEGIYLVGGAVFGALAPKVWDWATTRKDTDRRRRKEDVAEDAAAKDSAIRGFAEFTETLLTQRREDLAEYKRKLEQERDECKREIAKLKRESERDKRELLTRIVELEAQVGIT